MTSSVENIEKLENRTMLRFRPNPLNIEMASVTIVIDKNGMLTMEISCVTASLSLSGKPNVSKENINSNGMSASAEVTSRNVALNTNRASFLILRP
jgi:hypothetical protein